MNYKKQIFIGVSSRTIGLWLGFLVIFIVVMNFNQLAWAILDLHVQEELTVYEKPSIQSRSMTQLSRGDKVVISPKIYGSFRKVLVSYEGGKKGGYILAEKILRSTIRTREDEALSTQRIYSRQYSLGFHVVGSYQRQGARKFTTSSQDTYDISNLDSKSFFFSVFTDIPWQSGLMWRPYLSFRSVNFMGEAKLQGATNVFRAADLKMEQKFLGLGLLGKLYSHSLSSFWYGGGVELVKRTNSKNTINDGIPLVVEDKGTSLLILAYGSIGWDIPTPSSFFLMPDFRLGLIPTSNPRIYFLETFLGISYLF